MQETPSILIVDDEPDNRMILETYLRGTYHTESAESGEEAWEMMVSRKNNYSLVLLDWMMPGQSGLDILEKMQKHMTLRHTQVIMQTARARAEEIQKGIEFGAWYYLTKPFEEETLLAIIQTALTDRQTYLALQESILDPNTKPLTGNRVAIRSLKEARNLAALLAKICHDPEKRGLGFMEILFNAIEHGNLGITYDEKSELLTKGLWEKEIDRRLTLPENREKVVEVHIERHKVGVSFLIKDQGNGFNFQKYLAFDPDRITHTHGRGIAIANNISFDRMEYLGCGNEVLISIKKKGSELHKKTETYTT